MVGLEIATPVRSLPLTYDNSVATAPREQAPASAPLLVVPQARNDGGAINDGARIGRRRAPSKSR